MRALRRRPADADGGGIRRRLAPLVEQRAVRAPLAAVFAARHAGDHYGDGSAWATLSSAIAAASRADAVDRGSQRRVLARRPGAALRAADHESSLGYPAVTEAEKARRSRARWITRMMAPGSNSVFARHPEFLGPRTEDPPTCGGTANRSPSRTSPRRFSRRS